jgi:hypothetical protein
MKKQQKTKKKKTKIKQYVQKQNTCAKVQSLMINRNQQKIKNAENCETKTDTNLKKTKNTKGLNSFPK